MATTTRPPAVARPMTRTELGLLWASFAATAPVSWCYLRDPDGVGGELLGWANRLVMVVMAIGPFLRHARPARVWILAPLAGIFLCVTTFFPDMGASVGPFSYSDFPFIAAYTCLILLFVLLGRIGRRLHDENMFLDTAAGTIGVALALWCSALASVSLSELPSGIVWAIYPPLDVALLAVCLHLTLRLGTVLAPLAWFMAGMVIWLVIDTLYALNEILSHVDPSRAVEVGFLVAHLFMAVAFVHPSIGALRQDGLEDGAGRRPERAAAFAVLTISPAVLASVIPIFGMVDAIVRALLVALLLALLFVRISRTMEALSQAEADSHDRATHDGLTGLLNRSALFDLLERRRVLDRARGRSTAVFFVDCDDFKHVNDTWGHGAGDNLLRDIAGRLSACLGVNDLLARHGGDEFVVVTSTSDPMAVQYLAERLHGCFADSLRLLPGRGHVLTPSIGIAVAGPDDDGTVDDILGRADAAMYEAKQRGKDRRHVFDDDLAARGRVRAQVGDRIGPAVRAGDIDVHLQPIMGGPAYEQLVGWEALARWTDPELGPVAPDVFIPLAEQLGLIAPLGDALLQRAAERLAVLRATAPSADLTMNVNVSPAQLLQPDFAKSVLAVIERAGLPVHALHIEVTENLLVGAGSPGMSTLAELRAAGVVVGIDDFGTGYASLATLSHLPADCVKIDRSVLAGVGEEVPATRRFAAVLALLESLGLTQVVAEGVETSEQERALLELGCPMVQGWLYGRAEPFETVLAALRLGPPHPDEAATVADPTDRGATPTAASAPAADGPDRVLPTPGLGDGTPVSSIG